MRTLTASLALALLLTAGLGAQSASYRVGLASARITPETPIPMAGYAGREKPFEGVDGDLYAKALAIEDGQGGRALLVTADILGFPSELAERICSRLAASEKIAREDILLNGSHTHSGPLVAGSMMKLLPTAQQEEIQRYVRTLEDKVVEAGQKALRSTQPANFSWGRGVAKFVMNRREFTDRGVILGTNPLGRADRTVPVMRVASPDGKLLAVLFGAGSHNTTLTGGNMRISGDYAGFAQDGVQARLPGVQAMFMTGCAGDANPYPRGTLALAKQHGAELAQEVLRVLETELTPISGPIKTEYRMVELPLEKLTHEDVKKMAVGAPSYRTFFTDAALKIFEEGKTIRTTYTAPFALWQFGDDLTLVAYSGETLVDYAVNAERLLGPLKLWVAGYSNDLFGYLPPTRVLEEGGYETRGLYSDYGLFTPETEGVVMKAIEDMARSAGRELPGQ